MSYLSEDVSTSRRERHNRLWSRSRSVQSINLKGHRGRPGELTASSTVTWQCCKSAARVRGPISRSAEHRWTPLSPLRNQLLRPTTHNRTIVAPESYTKQTDATSRHTTTALSLICDFETINFNKGSPITKLIYCAHPSTYVFPKNCIYFMRSNLSVVNILVVNICIRMRPNKYWHR